MDKFIQQLNQEFESSSGSTPQWKAFYRLACSTFKKGLKTFATDIKMSRGHFEFSGFFTAKTGQMFYFSLSDVRFFRMGKLLIRTASSYKDYSGGQNQYVSVNGDMFENIKRISERKY